MAKVHVLDVPTTGRVNVAIHFPTPATNNSAGNSWSDVLAATGLLGVYGTADEEGVRTPYLGVGAAEVVDIEAGTILEITAELPDSGVADPDDRKAALEIEADREVDEWRQQYQSRYAYYGLAFGAVS